jgi:uncharacterized protein
MPVKLIEDIVKALVDKPDEVVIDAKSGERTVRVDVEVAKEDIGKVIGKKGSVIEAIRLISKNCGLKNGKRIVLNLIE